MDVTEEMIMRAVKRAVELHVWPEEVIPSYYEQSFRIMGSIIESAINGE